MPSSQKDHWGYTINEWKTDQFAQLLSRLPSDLDVIYDVGANVGGWTEVMSDKYPFAAFYCFEPVFENYDVLIKNVPWAKNLPYGIWYGARTSKVHSRGDHNVGAFFVEHIEAGDPIVEHEGELMQLRTFEELDLLKPDLIKFDIEGAEENVIENSTLVKTTPYLIVEWHPNRKATEFFSEHLPNHEIVHHIADMQFLLRLKPLA